jgi:hypothetical protein
LWICNFNNLYSKWCLSIKNIFCSLPRHSSGPRTCQTSGRRLRRHRSYRRSCIGKFEFDVGWINRVRIAAQADLTSSKIRLKIAGGGAHQRQLSFPLSEKEKHAITSEKKVKWRSFWHWLIVLFVLKQISLMGSSWNRKSRSYSTY